MARLSRIYIAGPRTYGGGEFGFLVKVLPDRIKKQEL
jgi:hypothetical protein